jgi:hypothetical protein
MTLIPDISLSRAMAEPSLFGKVFAAPSFWTWKVVAKLIDGLPLTEPREIDLFKQCTGRTQLLSTAALSKPLRRLILLAGRRAGKDRFLSAVATWRAALCTNWRQHQSAGEGAAVILIGADRKQAAILRRYCHGLLQQPLLAAEVSRRTDEVIEFRNGAALEIATNDARLVRGRSAIAVLGSECCHWKTDEHSASSDEEVVAAAEPSMAMTPDGGLLLLGSSVYRKRGYMYRKFRELHGNDDSDDLCWFAPSAVMNPRLPAHMVDAALSEDPARGGAEFLNRWREDIADFVPLDVIEACTEFERYERPPQYGNSYVAFCDAAGGTGADSFTLAVCHRLADDLGTVVLDVLRERKPRFVPADVVRDYAQLLRLYNIDEVQGDRYAGGFHADEWQRHGILFKPAQYTTSDNYLRTLPMLLSGRAKLIDSSTLRSQLASLERHVSAGHEVVRHPQVASAHDDLATACCGALVAAGDRLAYDASMRWVDGSPIGDHHPDGRAIAREEAEQFYRQKLHAYLRANGAFGWP